MEIVAPGTPVAIETAIVAVASPPVESDRDRPASDGEGIAPQTPQPTNPVPADAEEPPSTPGTGSASSGQMPFESPLQKRIAELKRQRAEMRRLKRQNANELRNAERKRLRLKAKAKLLNNNDLMEVYSMRMAEDNEKAAKKANASS